MRMADVVARLMDGTVLKGRSDGLSPTRDVFLLQVEGDAPLSDPVPIDWRDLKALFVVKRLDGDSAHDEKNRFTDSSPINGRKMSVVFKDNERLLGTSAGYSPGCRGFYLTPADPWSNNIRCCVFPHATQSIAYV
jgi:hypothetical protein